MELDKIYELMNEFKKSGIGSLEIKEGDFKIKMQMPAPVTASPTVYAPAPAGIQSDAAVSLQPAVAETTGLFIKSPIVGTFYEAPGEDQEPYVAKGKSVKKGETVCIVEAMKMMNEVTAPYDCVIEDIMKENGSAVGFDEPLFRIREL